MTEVINWLITNKETVIQLLTGVVSVASILATLIPNDSANAWIARANKVVSWLALNIGKAKPASKND
jgi:hypothetical protein